MISLVFLFGLIALASSNNFLRQLTVPSSLDSLDKTCFTSIGKLVITLDETAYNNEWIEFKLNSQAEGASEENNYAYICEAKDEPLSQFSCNPDTTGKTPLPGTYKVENVIHKFDSGTNQTSLE